MFNSFKLEMRQSLLLDPKQTSSEDMEVTDGYFIVIIIYWKNMFKKEHFRVQRQRTVKSRGLSEVRPEKFNMFNQEQVCVYRQRMVNSRGKMIYSLVGENLTIVYLVQNYLQFTREKMIYSLPGDYLQFTRGKIVYFLCIIFLFGQFTIRQ